MSKKVLLVTAVVAIFGLTLIGCESSSTSERNTQSVIYSGPDASGLKFGDKATTVTPCQVGGTPLATFILGSEDVDIMNEYVQGDEVFLLTRWGYSDECRWVKIKQHLDSVEIGYDAEILVGTTLLYGVSIRQEIQDLDYIQFEEYTLTDNLWVKAEMISATEIEESFSYNGAVATKISRDIGPEIYDLPAMIQEAMDGKTGTIGDLFGYSSTLYDNNEGERLTQLMEDTSFGQWLYNRHHTGDLTLGGKRWSVSDWFNACTTLKCLAGGFANPVCATCAVVSGGLMLTKAIVCAVDCDEWPDGL